MTTKINNLIENQTKAKEHKNNKEHSFYFIPI